MLVNITRPTSASVPVSYYYAPIGCRPGCDTVGLLPIIRVSGLLAFSLSKQFASAGGTLCAFAPAVGIDTLSQGLLHVSALISSENVVIVKCGLPPPRLANNIALPFSPCVE